VLHIIRLPLQQGLEAGMASYVPSSGKDSATLTTFHPFVVRDINVV